MKNFLAMMVTVAATLAMLAAPAAAVEPAKIVALGDSLSAGYGLAAGDGFTDRLEARLKADGLDVEVINAGVSGDTSKAGLARLDWSVPDDTALVILELGANDALRGIEPAETRSNLDSILTRLKQRNIRILLAGMIAPPNMGEDYGAAFNPVFAELAGLHGVTLYPFFLDGVAGEKALNQADGMHPNTAGVELIAARIAPLVVELLGKKAP